MTMTLESVRLRLLLIPFAAAALTVGCGEGHVLQSPTGPSSALDSAPFLTADGTDNTATASSADTFDTLAKGGNGKGSGKDKGTGSDISAADDAEDSSTGTPDRGRKPANGGGPGRSHEDRIVGFVSAKTADTLTVNGITVVAGMDTVIRHGHRMLTMDAIAVGDHVQARGVMEGTTLVATEIKVQDTGDDNDEDDDVAQAELKGAISGLNLTTTPCPSVTFTIGTTVVKTSTATTFDDVACEALVNGNIVEVEGTKQADGSILATRVELEAGPDEVEGTVFEFSGATTCPAANFKVGVVLSLATKVTVTDTTKFTGVTCATLANGSRVEVEGTKQADGSIAAASVELK